MGSNKLVRASFKELIRLTRLFNIHALNPIVIGGWAVHYYTKGPGSIDIDLALPSKEAIQIFEKYCRQYGFKRDKRAKTRVAFRKEIKTKPRQREEIMLDIFMLSGRNLLAANRAIEIPWKLSEKYSREWKIAKDTIARIPEKEVLLMYKAAALIDRRFKIKTWADLPKITRDRLKAKMEKDKNDIQGLLKLDIDQEKLEKLLEETKFKKLFEETINELKNKKDKS